MSWLLRLVSRISVRLLAFNLLLVFLPVAGVYYLDTYEIDCLTWAGSFRASVERTLQEIVELAALVDELSPSTIEQAIAPGGPLEGVVREHSASQGTAPVVMQSGPFAGRHLPALGLEREAWEASDATRLFEAIKVKAEQDSAQRAAAIADRIAASAAAAPTPPAGRSFCCGRR